MGNQMVTFDVDLPIYANDEPQDENYSVNQSLIEDNDDEVDE